MALFAGKESPGNRQDYNSLIESVGGNYAWVSESELRCALGTPDIWKNWEITRGNAISPLGTFLLSIGVTVPTILPNPKPTMGPVDQAVVNTSSASNPSSFAGKDSLTLFQWLSAFSFIRIIR